MKRIVLTLISAVIALALCTSASARDGVSFGILGGLTSSSSTVKGADAGSISQYHAGVALQIPLSCGFALQPGVQYHVKGMKLDGWKDATISEIAGDFQTKVGYLEVPVQIQWGPDLIAFRPYVFAEPFIGYRLTDKSKGTVAEALGDNLKKIEYGLGVGVGLEFWKLQVSAKYFWNFGDIYNSGTTAYDTVKDAFKNGNNFNGIAVSVGFFF